MINHDENNTYTIIVNIENKPYLDDPEGKTILSDLIYKEGYRDILSVKTGRTLKIEINAKNIIEAKSKIKKMCDDLRIYNPIVSDCKVYAEKTK